MIYKKNTAMQYVCPLYHSGDTSRDQGARDLEGIRKWEILSVS